MTTELDPNPGAVGTTDATPITDQQRDEFRAGEVAFLATFPVTPCPPWCVLPAGHPWQDWDESADGTPHPHRSHHTERGMAELWWNEGGGVPPTIWVSGEECTPSDARLLIRKLRHLIDLAESDPRAATDTIPDSQTPAEVAAARIPATPCPGWCELGSGHSWEVSGGDEFFRVHQLHSTLFDGPAVELWEAVTVLNPDEFAAGADPVLSPPTGQPTVSAYMAVDHGDDLPPADARALAAELIRFAQIADGATPVPTMAEQVNR